MRVVGVGFLLRRKKLRNIARVGHTIERRRQVVQELGLGRIRRTLLSQAADLGGQVGQRGLKFGRVGSLQILQVVQELASARNLLSVAIPLGLRNGAHTLRFRQVVSRCSRID